MSDVFANSSGGIVPALDTPSLETAVELVGSIDDVPGVVGYKFGMVVALERGLAEGVRRLREVTDRPLIYDHQKAGPDVASMGEHFASICAAAGVDACVLFPLGGPGVVDAFVRGCDDRGVTVVVGGDLPEKDFRVSGGGYVADDALYRIFDRAGELGVRDYVIPATDPDRIRSLSERLRAHVDTPNVFMPGVGALGGTIADAARTVEGCRPFFIIGRGICQSEDPRDAVTAYAAEYAQAVALS